MTQRTCQACNGTGKCKPCEGRGSFDGLKSRPGEAPAATRPSLPCSSCFGAGRCRECGGNGQVASRTPTTDHE
jgi:hypothetical protein